MSNSTVYLRAAESLRHNEGQWAAYNSQSNCIILAGPGSGKTKTLTIKLARMLMEDVQSPRGIACITYNNECARELEERLETLGIEHGKRLFTGTVHSFSLTQIILPYAKIAQMGLPENFQIATSNERKVALERAVIQTIGGPGNPQEWAPRMEKYRKSFVDRDCDEWSNSDPELAQLVEAYEAELRTLGRIDFDDMPILANSALRNHAWLRNAICAKYPILVVDEYQDLGLALHHIVMQLCFNTGVRLLAVGDVDQSIYGFTGAHPELLQELSSRSDVEKIQLRLNYRCGSRIVTASTYALGEQRDYVSAKGVGEGTIYFHAQHGSFSKHASFLFSSLLPEIRARFPHIKPGDIAILYPAAYLGDYVANEAQSLGISILRSDTKALYPRGNRLMRWIEHCAEWHCGGWKTGTPRFERIFKDGKRLFAEAISSKNDAFSLQQKLIHVLWNQREHSTTLALWLQNLYDILISKFAESCCTLEEETTILKNLGLA